MNKAKWMSGMMNPVTEKSCHRILIGKCYWKSVFCRGSCLEQRLLVWGMHR